MISSLRLRMMTAVSLLAIAAVVAVALAARQRTRSEFRRFQELEKILTSSNPDGDSERIAYSDILRAIKESLCETSSSSLPFQWGNLLASWETYSCFSVSR